MASVPALEKAINDLANVVNGMSGRLAGFAAPGGHGRRRLMDDDYYRRRPRWLRGANRLVQGASSLPLGNSFAHGWQQGLSIMEGARDLFGGRRQPRDTVEGRGGSSGQVADVRIVSPLPLPVRIIEQTIKEVQPVPVTSLPGGAPPSPPIPTVLPVNQPRLAPSPAPGSRPVPQPVVAPKSQVPPPQLAPAATAARTIPTPKERRAAKTPRAGNWHLPAFRRNLQTSDPPRNVLAVGRTKAAPSFRDRPSVGANPNAAMPPNTFSKEGPQGKTDALLEKILAAVEKQNEKVGERGKATGERGTSYKEPIYKQDLPRAAPQTFAQSQRDSRGRMIETHRMAQAIGG